MKHDKPKRETRKLKDLRPHPMQAVYFGDLSEADLKALADDIRRNGLRHPIEVLPENKAGHPPNTTLKGHQRTRALLRNGVTETEVLVRYDLADADDAAIETAFLEDDLSRRHLDNLGKARIVLRRFEIEKKRPRGGLRRAEEAEARDRVGKAIGMSGRNLQRYLNILRAPIQVQDAFRGKELSLVDAAKIGCMPERVQRDCSPNRRRRVTA